MSSLVLTDRERLMLRALILQRQAGNTAGSITFLMRTDIEDNKKKEALIAQLKCDLGDLILQVEMLVKDLGLNLDEVKSLSYDRYDECKNEFKMNGKSQYFI